MVDASPGVMSTPDSDLPTEGQGQHLPVGDRGQEWGPGLHLAVSWEREHLAGAAWTELMLYGGGGAQSLAKGVVGWLSTDMEAGGYKQWPQKVGDFRAVWAHVQGQDSQTGLTRPAWVLREFPRVLIWGGDLSVSST